MNSKRSNITPELEALFPRIYEVGKQVPWGTVTTYGAVAQIVGAGGDARLVGYAMAGGNGRAESPNTASSAPAPGEARKSGESGSKPRASSSTSAGASTSSSSA